MQTYREYTAKQQTIISAAENCFLNEGYQACSMERIAEAAQVAKQTVYNNFASKEELFTAVMLSMCSAMADPELRSPNPAKPPEETLLKFAHSFLNMITQPKALVFFRILMAEGHQHTALADTFFDNACKPITQMLAEVFAAFHAAGKLHAPNPELTAEAFLAATKGGMYYEFLLDQKPLPTKEKIDTYLKGVVALFVR